MVAGNVLRASLLHTTDASEMRAPGDDNRAGASDGTEGASYGVPCTVLLLASAVGVQTRRQTVKVNFDSNVDVSNK